MRYTVLTLERSITESPNIGVLVAAALVATLGLPSAAQAQTIGADGGVTFSDDGDGFDRS